MLVMAMVEQGLSLEEARRRFYVCDKDGLLGATRVDKLDANQQKFMRPNTPGSQRLPDSLASSL
jgi:hypothetical protein